MEGENRELLVRGVFNFGIELEEKAIEAFDLYLRELLKWNQKINLTAIRSERGIVLKHFIDSLSAFPHLTGISSLLDMGSGGGFPGIPLKIVQSSLKVTLIDSVQKKVDFQRHIIRTLGLKGIEAIHGRIQEKGILEPLRGSYDGVISRAFSRLQAFLPLAFPSVKKGGVIIAMKGELTDEELRYLSRLEEVPCRLEKMVHLSLPFSSIRRTILLFEKR